MGHVIEETAELDRVKGLWLGMVEHHGEVTGLPVRAPEESWRRRRAEYEAWLADGRTFLLLALNDQGEPDGYALVRVRDGGSTFDLGEPVGELESLAVAPRSRGQGVGTLLIGAARERLRALGVAHWTVDVMEANESARRLYEREGFGPHFSALIERIG